MQLLTELEWLRTSTYWAQLSLNKQQEICLNPSQAIPVATYALNADIIQDYGFYIHSLVPIWPHDLILRLPDNFLIPHSISNIILGIRSHGLGDQDTIVFAANSAAHWFVEVWGFMNTTDIYSNEMGQCLQKLHTSSNRITLSDIRKQLNHKLTYGIVFFSS